MAGVWKRYRWRGLHELRPYEPGEDLSVISVSTTETPQLGGMIARNPTNHIYQWYVSKYYLEKNLELVEEE